MKLENISKYRTEIMGFAVLWIACYHGPFSIPIKSINFFVKSISYGGVDIFIFLSSFGLYYSFAKNSNILEFYKRRFLRIIPYFIPIMIVYIIKNSLTAKDSILYLTTLKFWFDGGMILWYVPAIVILYIITPLYLKIFNKKPHASTVVSILVSLVLGYLMIGHKQMIFFSRLPIFFLGFYFAYLNTKKIDIKPYMLVLIYLFMLFGFVLVYTMFHVFGDFMWSHGLYWYPFFLIVPGLVLLLGKIVGIFKGISKPLKIIGSVSFEFYLLNEYLVDIANRFIAIGIDSYGILKFLLVTIVTLVLAKLYNCLIKKLLSRIIYN